MDDTYKTKAKDLYDSYSSIPERDWDMVSGGFSFVWDFFSSFMESLIKGVGGIIVLVGDVFTYIGGLASFACDKVFGDSPDFLKNCEGKVR